MVRKGGSCVSVVRQVENFVLKTLLRKVLRDVKIKLIRPRELFLKGTTGNEWMCKYVHLVTIFDETFLTLNPHNE